MFDSDFIMYEITIYAFILNFRKNAVEIELARTRIDVMHINSQLMEAVQQKVELSQQLEQWKVYNVVKYLCYNVSSF